MPLDPRKSQHIQNVVARTFAGRQRTVVVVYLASGVYSYSAISVIMRPEQILDPQIADASGQPPLHTADMLMIAPLGTSFAGAVYVADTPTPSPSTRGPWIAAARPWAKTILTPPTATITWPPT